MVDYVISGNDDAIRAVKLLASIIADAVIEAKQGEDAVKHAHEEVTNMAQVEVSAEEVAAQDAVAEEAVAAVEAKESK
jgi:small subunit ribosomal protein S2